MIAHHSSVAQSAYIDLRRQLLDEAASDLRGTPTRLLRNGRTYWYDSYRVGNDLKKRYIGEDSPELAERLANHAALSSARKARDANRARLVRILRAEGMANAELAVGSLLNAMARAGVFRLGGTLIGTNAFRLYEGELGLRLSLDQASQTDDVDIAQFEQLSLSLALDETLGTSLADTFTDLDFQPVPDLKPRAYWRWKQTRSDMLVEFLTPSFRDQEDIRDLPALGVSAQSLHFLNFLIADPIKAAVLYRSGILVQIPRPEAFAIHKLIVADRRSGPDRLKAAKDRLQARLLIEALAQDRPADLKEAHEDALSRGPKWQAHIAATLARMPETAALIAAL